MTTEVDVCNLALSHIRAETINSLNEASVAAIQCKILFPILRDQMLMESCWTFNRKLEPLAVLPLVDIFNWNIAYQYPTDCLRITRLILNFEEINESHTTYRYRYGTLYDDYYQPNLRRKVEYEVFNVSGNRVIAANECELRIDYSARMTDTSLWTAQFILAFSHLLAAELAIPIAGVEKGRSLRSDSLGLYNKYFTEAQQHDINQRYTLPADSELISIRRY